MEDSEEHVEELGLLSDQIRFFKRIWVWAEGGADENLERIWKQILESPHPNSAQGLAAPRASTLLPPEAVPGSGWAGAKQFEASFCPFAMRQPWTSHLLSLLFISELQNGECASYPKEHLG